MKNSRKILRLLCISLILAVVLSTFSSCTSHPLSPEKQALKVVGTVGEYEVPYEELYFLASNYKTDDMTEEELWETISENIISNYAILTLCDGYDVDYTEKEIEDSVQNYIDTIIEEDFGGSRKDYISALEESYMTDHYVRFTAKVDIMYDSISTYLSSSSEIATDEETVIDHLSNNFVRTWHLMIANNAGDDPAENLANAEAALAKLRNGETTMFDLIGGPLNEDLLIGIDGYSFGKGSMEKAYEDAAFSLEVGEYSEVICAKGDLANGEYVDCYYIIQRLPFDTDFIKKNYNELYKQYESSIVAQKVDQIKNDLEFVPNEYANSLNILELEEIDAGTDIFTIVVVSVCIASAIGVAIVIFFLVRYFKKKKERLILEAKARRSK